MPSEDDVFRALADPTRRLILKHNLSMTKQGIGKHLSVMRRAGLVSAHRTGKYLVLNLDDAPVRRISERWLQRLVRE